MIATGGLGGTVLEPWIGRYWLVAVAWVCGWVLYRRLVTVRPPAGTPPAGTPPTGTPPTGTLSPGTPPPVSVIIPARNEAAALPRLLTSLAAELPPGSDVHVVDDHSTDDTFALAGAAADPLRAAGVDLHITPAAPLPPGWTGKNWAMTQAADHISATHPDDRLLVFLDADVEFAPGGLAACLAERGHTDGLLSVQPWHTMVRPAEHLSTPFNIVAAFAAVGATDRAAAFGPVMTTTLGDYRRVGGHRSVAGSIVDDVALAQRYRIHHLAVRTRLGSPSTVRFRMYPAGVRPLLEGWSKNFASGAAASSVNRLLMTIVWVTGWIEAAILFLDAVGGSVATIADLAVAAAFYSQVRLAAARVGNATWLTVLASPLLVACFVGVFAHSLYRTRVRRSVAWRGRWVRV